MADTVAADLAELKELADIYLQDLANGYDDANHGVAGTADNDSAAFRVYPHDSSGPGGTAMDSVYSSWSLLRDALCDYLADTSTNYQSAVTAMHHIIQTFADADGVSASQINDVYQEYLKTAASIGDKPVAPDSRPVIIR